MRKNLLLLPVLCFLSSELTAQVEKGRMYGEFEFGRWLFNYNANTIRPGISIGLNEHSTLGVFYTYTRLNSIPGVNGKKDYTEVSGAGVSYSYYRYFKNKTKWGWYGNTSLGQNKVSSFDGRTGNYLLVNRYNEKWFSLTPGVIFKARPGVMFFGNIGDLSLRNSRYHEIRASTSFGKLLNLGLRVNLFDLKKKIKADPMTKY